MSQKTISITFFIYRWYWNIFFSGESGFLLHGLSFTLMLVVVKPFLAVYKHFHITTCFFVHITRSSVNFTGFPHLSHYQFDDRSLEKVLLFLDLPFLIERPLYIYIYIYIYIYMVIFGQVKKFGVIPSGQENHSRAEHLNFPGRELNVIYYRAIFL